MGLSDRMECIGELRGLVMDRRSFVKTGFAGFVANAVSNIQMPTAPPTTGLDFDFTGLYAFHASEASHQLRVVLVDGPKAGIRDEHAALLVMAYDDYEKAQEGIPVRDRYDGPKIIRLGPTALAVWSLAALKLWVPKYHAKFDDIHPEADLTVDDTPLPPTPPDPTVPLQPPVPRNEPQKWASMLWFASYEHLLGGEFEPPPPQDARKVSFDMAAVSSMVRLTRGHVSGRMPATECERERTYTVAGDKRPRTFNSQFHCAYEHTAGVAELAVSEIEPHLPRKIGVTVTAGRLTPIFIVNTSLKHTHRRHYRAFYYGLAGAAGKEIEYTRPCPGGMFMTDEPQSQAAPTRSGPPDAPDPDCIPPRAHSIE